MKSVINGEPGDNSNSNGGSANPSRVEDSELNDQDSSINSPDRSRTKERRKIQIKFIENKTRRHVTFSKRKYGIMKKAFELSVLTGTQVLLLVVPRRV